MNALRRNCILKLTSDLCNKTGANAGAHGPTIGYSLSTNLGEMSALYNVNADPTENNDLAAKMPDKLKELQALFYSEAQKYNVFPLDNSTVSRALTERPSPTAGKTVFTYSSRVSGIPADAAPNILQRSFNGNYRPKARRPSK